MLNGILLLHTTISMLVCSSLLGVPFTSFVTTFSWFFFRVALVYGATHALGELLLGGRSSESLVGETIIKGLLVKLTGRSANQGGKDEPKKSK
jgi:hypothetical protein